MEYDIKYCHFSPPAPNDFAAKTDEEITFSPSQTFRTSNVSLENDDIAEDEESFQLTLTRPADSPQGLEIAEGVVTVYLRDADSEYGCSCIAELRCSFMYVVLLTAVVIQLSTTAYTWSEGVGEVVIVMEKIGTAERDVTATLQAVSLTAEGSGRDGRKRGDSFASQTYFERAAAHVARLERRREGRGRVTRDWCCHNWFSASLQLC